jgi:hypothetical protein
VNIKLPPDESLQQPTFVPTLIQSPKTKIEITPAKPDPKPVLPKTFWEQNKNTIGVATVSTLFVILMARLIYNKREGIVAYMH